MDKYLLRNVTKRDVLLGDLGYKIPVGQVRDLLSRTARMDRKRLEKSVVSGSIRRRIDAGILVEVITAPDLRPPKKLDVSEVPVSFPRQPKSSIVLDVNKLDEQHQNIILSEEDDLLKELQEEDMLMEADGAPLVAKQGKDEKDVEAKEDV